MSSSIRMSSSNNTGGVVIKSSLTVDAVTRMRIENPFAFKVGQVFTGFGVGCGIGIGIGRPINLGAIPMLNQVMGATRGATDIFHGVGRHANTSLRKLGVKNLEAGIGCGLGFGHGFGIGLAVKPRVMHQIQSTCIQAVTKLMMKCGIVPNQSHDQGLKSLQSGMPHIAQSPIDGILRLGTKEADQASQFFQKDRKSLFSREISIPESSYGTRTENVLNSFLQNPLFGEQKGIGKDQIGHLQSENNILHMVLKHQQIIEDLMEENERIRQILVQDLKIPPSKLEDGRHLSKTKLTCDECFECRRKQRLK